MIPSVFANYNKNKPFWYVKPSLLASVSPTIPLLMITIVVKTVVKTARRNATKLNLPCRLNQKYIVHHVMSMVLNDDTIVVQFIIAFLISV